MFAGKLLSSASEVILETTSSSTSKLVVVCTTNSFTSSALSLRKTLSISGGWIFPTFPREDAFTPIPNLIKSSVRRGIEICDDVPQILAEKGPPELVTFLIEVRLGWYSRSSHGIGCKPGVFFNDSPNIFLLDLNFNTGDRLCIFGGID